MNYRSLWLGFALVVASAALIFLSPGKAQADNRVGLVVQYLDGTIEKRCVEIGAGEIKGIDVLNQSGLEVRADFNASIGVAVCQIGNNGCSPDNCFCDMPNYWSYWHLRQDDASQWRWMYSQIGASSSVVSPGDVEGWRYGTGQQPDEMPAFDEICLPATSTPTWTATPTATLPPTWTSAPASTSAPTATTAAARQATRPALDIVATAIMIYATPSETAILPPSPVPATPAPTAQPAAPTVPVSSPTPVLAASALLSSATAPVPTFVEPGVTPTGADMPAQQPAIAPTDLAVIAGVMNEPTPALHALPPQPVSLAQAGPAAPVVQITLPPAALQVGSSDSTRSDTPLKKIMLVTGGLASMLGFLVFFGLLLAGLVVTLVWKRR